MELDDRDLRAEQFLTACDDGKLLGFGRIRKHAGCDEFCSLGVISSAQNKGIGKEITAEIIKISTQPLYLVCILPEYFKPFGFEIVSSFPAEMQDKLDYCNSCLPVDDAYVVMRLAV